jgi:ribonuclease BN (tRNA processing enzyme)
VGPPGLEQRLRALLDVTYGVDLLERDRAPEVQFEELSVGERTEVDGFALETFPADHMEPPEQPLCLRFTGPDGQRIAFSGDTAMCEGLLAAADDADLVVAECSGLAPPMGRHCTWEDWRKILPTLSARRVVLTHLGAEVRAAMPRLQAEALGFSPTAPRLDFAEDGLAVDLLPERRNLP